MHHAPHTLLHTPYTQPCSTQRASTSSTRRLTTATLSRRPCSANVSRYDPTALQCVHRRDEACQSAVLYRPAPQRNATHRGTPISGTLLALSPVSSSCNLVPISCTSLRPILGVILSVPADGLVIMLLPPLAKTRSTLQRQRNKGAPVVHRRTRSAPHSAPPVSAQCTRDSTPPVSVPCARDSTTTSLNPPFPAVDGDAAMKRRFLSVPVAFAAAALDDPCCCLYRHRRRRRASHASRL